MVCILTTRNEKHKWCPLNTADRTDTPLTVAKQYHTEGITYQKYIRGTRCHHDVLFRPQWMAGTFLRANEAMYAEAPSDECYGGSLKSYMDNKFRLLQYTAPGQETLW